MGLFDFFSGQDAQNAANAQIQGIQTGVTQATGQINQGSQALTSDYTAALQPFLQNYNTANAGVAQLQGLLGIPQAGAPGAAGAPAGAPAIGGGAAPGTPTAPMMPTGAGGAPAAGGGTPNSILQTLQNTPGYQFQLQQGDNAINAQAAATGSLASGNTALALSNYNQGLAGTTYQNAVNNLQPFLQSSNANAGGIANTYQGLGQGLNANQGSLANLDYTAQTGMGNAQANADLANYQASGNLWNTVGNVAKAGASFAPFLLSDERAKDDIEPVGELYDGTNVYRYRYKGDPRFQIGVMAQEVEATRPEAITEIGGLKHVNYHKATDLAASLARFIDGGDNVVKLDDFRSKTSGNPSDVFARFLEAA